MRLLAWGRDGAVVAIAQEHAQAAHVGGSGAEGVTLRGWWVEFISGTGSTVLSVFLSLIHTHTRTHAHTRTRTHTHAHT